MKQLLRERLHQLGMKARHDPKSLTLAEINELCNVVEALRPSERDVPRTPYG